MGSLHVASRARSGMMDAEEDRGEDGEEEPKAIQQWQPGYSKERTL